MADLTTRMCGLVLRNPLIVSSGPLTYSAEAICRAFAAGAAAAVTKTISRDAAVNPIPHIAALGKGSLLNTEMWSDFPPERWIQQELPTLRGAGGAVIASVGHHQADVLALATALVAAGSDALEVVSYHSADMVPMVEAAKERIKVPVFAKLSPNWPDLLDCAAGCLAAGADGLTAIDSLGPTLAIDVETGRTVLGGPGWLSGAAIKPLAVRIVADLCRAHPGVPVVATGGVSCAEDVVEMLMAGAAAVGAHTAPLLQGPGWFSKVLVGLDRWLDAHGYTALDDVRGLALCRLPCAERVDALEFVYEVGDCTECGACVRVCAYGARTMSGGEMRLDADQCRGCGLCASVCPSGALRATG